MAGPPLASACPVLTASDQSTGAAPSAGRAMTCCREVFTFATVPDTQRDNEVSNPHRVGLVVIGVY